MSDIWRFIESGTDSAFFNMALDEAIALTVRKGDAPPTLRLYRWAVPSVSIGCFQKMSDIDTGYCAERDIPVVRRPTGGRAVLHDDEITYSFSAKTVSGPFSNGLFDSYKRISAAFCIALFEIGFSPESVSFKETRSSSQDKFQRSPLCFQSTSYGEVTIQNRKIIGSAQKRWSDGLLQQGSIPLLIDKNTTADVFGIRTHSKFADTCAGLKEILPELNPDQLKDAIRISFEKTFGSKFFFSSPSREEVSLALKLEAEKYSSYNWNFKR